MDMSLRKRPIFLVKSGVLVFFTAASANAYSQLKVSYAVPEGFSAVEMDSSARYLATFNGQTLPDFITLSPGNGKLHFNQEKYLNNGVDKNDVNTLLKILSSLDYSACQKGCDEKIEGYRVSIDKLRRTITLRDINSDYLVPETHVGFLHNQSLDLRAASDSYRAMNINGNAWLGLPLQSFGYMNWYASRSQRAQQTSQGQGISSWYMQKNFTSTYLRAGKQNSVDYSSGSVSTLLTPSFNQFITVGSQSHLLTRANHGSLVFFASAEGNYEFWRNGRMILKRPAVLGRNEIDYADLPGGYYSLEVRLVDRNGRLIKTEMKDVNNVNFSSGENSWSLTAGREMQTHLAMLQASWSQDMRWFFMNTSAIIAQRGKWAAELNLTRPMNIAIATITPTLGLLTGERKNGGYASLSINSATFGSLSLSRYQNNEVSHFYQGSSSSSLTYSYLFRGSTLSYNYQRFAASEQQQTEVRWNYRPNGLWATFALGLQKGGYQQSGSNYGLYFNTTWTLNNTQVSLSAARSGGETQLSGDYRKDFSDEFGETTAGTTVSRTGARNNINLYASRSGSRGDASLSVGHGDNTTNADFNYRGMFAADAQGLALGRYSYSGAAMLLDTPAVKGMDYGFRVEGAPVAGGHRYAVPLKAYTDVPFAQVISSSQSMDMNVEVPANIVRVHPGQVYHATASVDINLLYNGFMKDAQGVPVSGVIKQTGDRVYPNGLFSIASKTLLSQITVEGAQGRFRCDLTRPSGSNYTCQPLGL